MAKIILIVDDNPKIREQLCRLFEAEKHYEVCAQAGNGREAIDLAVKLRPDLIVLDLSMPVMNGLDAARELKLLLPQLPIILFTQYADLGKQLSASTSFVDAVVAKSEPLELIRRTRALLPV